MKKIHVFDLVSSVTIGVAQVCYKSEFLDSNVLHGGENVDVDTLHGGEYVDPDTLHGGENVDIDTLHGGEYVDIDTLHGGEYVDPDTLHGGENVDVDTLHGGEFVDPDTLHGGEYVDPDTLHEEVYNGDLWRNSRRMMHNDYDILDQIDPDTLSGWSEHKSQNSGRLYNYAFVKRMDGHIDIAIQTPASGRDESLNIIHKLPLEGNNEGVMKICIKKPEAIMDSSKAFGVMKEYVELFDKYIDSGITIDNQLRK